jgi:hypothetical protein
VPLESATYIHELEPSNPAGTDQLAQGDDHLRMLKAVLRATFPNITGPVTVDQDTLNASTSTIIPIGIITAWYGDSASCPDGWAVCNGQTVARTDGAGNITTPDMRDRVVVGAGSAIASQGNIAGAATSSVNSGSAGDHSHAISGGEHTHTGTAAGHALTIAEIPSHQHGNGVNDDGAGHVFCRGSHASPAPTSRGVGEDGSGNLEGLTEAVGGGQAHSHDMSLDASSHEHTIAAGGAHQHSVTVSTVQPCLGLHFIMKV